MASTAIWTTLFALRNTCFKSENFQLSASEQLMRADIIYPLLTDGDWLDAMIGLKNLSK